MLLFARFSVRELPFSSEWVQFLFEHRSDGLLQAAKFASLFGEVEGYVLVVALIYVCFDKHLAVRLAIVALLAMTFNHFLKILIGNPRPFVADGSFTEKWAVSPENMTELASEFSTPSGHAMSASAFYSYLAFGARNCALRVAANSDCAVHRTIAPLPWSALLRRHTARLGRWPRIRHSRVSLRPSFWQ